MAKLVRYENTDTGRVFELEVGDPVIKRLEADEIYVKLSGKAGKAGKQEPEAPAEAPAEETTPAEGENADSE